MVLVIGWYEIIGLGKPIDNKVIELELGES